MPNRWDKPDILERWEYAYRERTRRFENTARLNYSYYNGTGHWSVDEEAELNLQERPITTLNYTFKAINTLIGNEIQNRNDIYVFPMEGGDVNGANILNYGYKFVKKENNLDWEFTQANMDGYITSQGWLKNYIDFDYDGKPTLNIRHINPLFMYFDPDSISLPLDDCQDVFEAQWINREKLKKMYPDKADEIDKFTDAKNLMDHSLYVDRGKHMVRILYSEWRSHERKKVFADEEGNFYDEEPDDIDTKPFYKTVSVVKGARYLGRVELEAPIENPYGCGKDKFSFTLLCPYFAKGTGVSVVDQFRSVQDIINKSYSQSMDILNRQPKVGGLYEKNAVKDPEALADISKTGNWIPVDDISKIVPTSPPQYPQAHMATVKDSIELLKEIIGTPEVFMGEAPGRVESGLGIQILKKQSGLSFEMPADNFRVAQTEVGKKILNQMSEFWTTKKFMRIAGEDGNFTDVDIQPTTVTTTKISREDGSAIGQPQTFSNKLKEGKYDFIIDVNTPSISQRMYNAMIALQLFQTMPSPQLASLMIDMLDFPKKEEWKAALMAPPPAPGGPTPGGGGGTGLEGMLPTGAEGPVV